MRGYDMVLALKMIAEKDGEFDVAAFWNDVLKNLNKELSERVVTFNGDEE